MEASVIINEVRSYVTESMVMAPGVSIADDTSFLTAQLIDSTGVLELIDFLENRYAIHIADEEMVPENLDSLTAIARYVAGKVAS